MFDIAPTELLLVAVVALVVIGPKDLPRAMRFVGQWIAKARGVARHFRTGIDEMIRQSELEEMEKKWAAENERIMREHPAQAVIEQTPIEPVPSAHVALNAPVADHGAPELPAPDPSLAGQQPALTSDMVPIGSAAQASLPLEAPVAKPKPRRKPAAKPAGGA